MQGNHQTARIITRRDFLKLSALGALATLVPTQPARALQENSHPTSVQHLVPANLGNQVQDKSTFARDLRQGRVIADNIIIYDTPSSQGNKVGIYWKDNILTISAITYSEDSEQSFNPIWYKIGEEGYAHSGFIQPVDTIINAPVDQIPPSGLLAEVSVPFTDAFWKPGFDQLVAHRYYFETTYWVFGIVYDAQNNPWYATLDDKWDLIYYVPATHLRIFSNEELSTISPDVPLKLKRIEINLAEQILTAYELDKPVFMARVATGARFRSGSYMTPPGHYITFHKRPSRHMARGNLAANGYDLPGVPWNAYITESGIALHGTYWHNNFGRPRSHGCINLTPQAARWIYRWTIPEVPPREQRVYENYGTAVDILEE